MLSLLKIRGSCLIILAAHSLLLFSCNNSSSPDTEPPAIPPNLFVSTTPSSIDLTWSGASDNVGVAAYKVYRDGTLLNAVTAKTFSDSGCARKTTYCYQVSAIDAAGNESGLSSQQCDAIYNVSYDQYSSASSLAWDGQFIYVSNYVEGGTGVGPRKIYKYDITTGASAGEIPSPSDWTDSICFDGTHINVVDYKDPVGCQIFGLSKDNGTIISSFSIDYYPATKGLAWDGQYLYLATYNMEANGPVTRIHKYDPSSGDNLGIIYTRYGLYTVDSKIYSTIEGLAYKDGSLWVLTDPDASGEPYKIINISLGGQELSTMDVPNSKDYLNGIRSLTYIEGAFWYIRTTYDWDASGLRPITELVRMAPSGGAQAGKVNRAPEQMQGRTRK